MFVVVVVVVGCPCWFITTVISIYFFDFKNVRGGGPSTATEGLHARCDVITSSVTSFDSQPFASIRHSLC
jgi:hypothetical protein